MARGWKCPRCSTQNGEGVMNCAKCGLIRGGVVVPGTYTPPESTVPPEWTASPSPLPPAAQGVGAPLHLEYGEGQATAGQPSDGLPLAGQPTSGWVAPSAAALSGRPLWRRIPLRLALFVVLIAGGGVAGWITNASRSSTGDITKSGDMTSNDLRVGDCWDMKDPSADTIDNVTARPCGEAHEYEVFFIGSLTGNDYPTEDQFSTYVKNNCVSAFTTYVGRAYADSSLDISWLYPESKGWAIGDRTVECSAYDPNNSQLTASVKGSGQ